MGSCGSQCGSDYGGGCGICDSGMLGRCDSTAAETATARPAGTGIFDGGGLSANCQFCGGMSRTAPLHVLSRRRLQCCQMLGRASTELCWQRCNICGPTVKGFVLNVGMTCRSKRSSWATPMADSTGVMSLSRVAEYHRPLGHRSCCGSATADGGGDIEVGRATFWCLDLRSRGKHRSHLHGRQRVAERSHLFSDPALPPLLIRQRVRDRSRSMATTTPTARLSKSLHQRAISTAAN